MMAKPLARPLPNASLPRNTFDRSFIMNLNFSAGMLLPVFAQFVPAGSKFRVNRSVFLRTAQLNTAAFPVIDYNIDFYCVPCNLLMSRYDEFKLNIQDNNSSAYGQLNSTAVPSRLPYFKYVDVISMLGDNLNDSLGIPIQHGTKRLFDLLGYDDTMLTQNMLAPIASTEVNCMKLLAYQKVYFDHYRNSAYESNNPFAYNADYAYTSTANGRITDHSILADICQLRYVNYRKDYFQALYPGLNYVLTDSYVNQWSLPNSFVSLATNVSVPLSGNSGSDAFRFTSGDLSNLRIDSNKRMVGSDTGGNDVQVNHNHLLMYGSASFLNDSSVYNVQAIRAAFALDKLLRASAYAPKHVKDQLEARYGVKLRNSYGHESQYLGSFGNQITIGEVTSTSNTEQTSGGVTTGDQLGAIGGKGVSGSTGGKTIEYLNESDSIVMGIAYATVRTLYDSNRIDNFNTKALKEDLPVPEFMDLGLRPLLLSEFTNTLDVNANNRILGYVTRDQEYKVGIDQNHGLFRLNNQLSVFTVHSIQRLAALPAQGNGVSYTYFKVSPSDLNSIFVTAFDPTSQLTDQFFGQIRFDFSSRQNMSVHGQPSL